MSLPFLLTSLVICLAPGTGALFTVAAGLTRGARAGVLAAFACTLGTVPHLLAALTGLTALLHAGGVAFQLLKYAGIGYLLWMAWSTWRDSGVLALDAAPRQPRSRRGVIYAGITINLLNPKLTIFFFAFLPQFVPSGPGGPATMLELSAVFMAMTFVTFAAYGTCAAALRERFLSRPRLIGGMRKVVALSFLGVGARLAGQSR